MKDYLAIKKHWHENKNMKIQNSKMVIIEDG